jgi:hypothetical protein
MNLPNPHANELADLSPETASFAEADNNTLREFTALGTNPNPVSNPSRRTKPQISTHHLLTTSPT